jgi:transcriptional regulator
LYLLIKGVGMMYIPKYYEMKDYEEIKRFYLLPDVQKHTAAYHPHKYSLAHVWQQVVPHQSKRTLNNNKSILVIFQGPHGYVSSTWYENEDVPTWDHPHKYSLAHVWQQVVPHQSKRLSQNYVR